MRKIKACIPLLLLSLYLSYQAGVTLFTHVHYVNGVAIVHSHPSKEKKHSHTSKQYLLIQQWSHIQVTEASAPIQLEEPELHFIILEEKTDTTSKQNVSQPHCLLRAPPVWRTSFIQVSFV